jgi:hypothetical protein
MQYSALLALHEDMRSQMRTLMLKNGGEYWSLKPSAYCK